MPLIAPSILASDFANLQKEIEMINTSEADWIHIDIMDGIFVPNISFGFPVLEAVQRHAKKPMDVHLMIEQPDRYVEAFAKTGAEIISVHVEACPHLHRNIQQIRSLGCKPGVAINPHTPITVLENIINDIEVVCVMSVNPGFGAQKFIEHTYKKVAALRQMIAATGSRALIEIDGGVNQQNAAALLQAGADILVAGNLVFSASDPQAVIRTLKAIKV